MMIEKGVKEAPMTFSPEMRQKIMDRFAALGECMPVSLVGPDLRCETVEDAERLVERFETWLVIFAELSAAVSTNENFADLTDDPTNNDDRAALIRLYNIFDKIVVDLELREDLIERRLSLFSW